MSEQIPTRVAPQTPPQRVPPMRQPPMPQSAVTQDQAERLARLRGTNNTATAGTSANGTTPAGARAKPMIQTAAKRRKTHPAKGARAVALAASVTATIGVGAAMAYADAAEQVTVAAITAAPTPIPTTAALEVPTTPTADSASGEPAIATAGVDVPASPTADSFAASEPATAAAPDESAVAQESADPTTTSGEVAVDPSPTVIAPNASGLADGIYDGSAEYTEWGNVQVRVTISDGKIIDVVSIQMPSGRKSSQINAGAEPVLEAQAIATQSADLDIVSGATYTSNTYEDSLQAALDQAAIAQQSATVQDSE